MPRHLVPVLVILFLGPTITPAATLHVPAEYPTIVAAMDASSFGDTVLVACGEYLEYDIHLKDGVALRSESGSAACVRIDGRSLGTVLEGTDLGPSTLVEGVTIAGGRGVAVYPEYRGGGLHCRNASPTVRDCVFTGNNVSEGGAGAGVFCENGSAPAFEHCAFTENGAVVEAYLGGGAACLQNSPARFEGCEFRGNIAWLGGGLYISGSSVEVRGCAFIENYVHPWSEVGPPGAGGGLYSFKSFARIEGCTFTRNMADDTLFLYARGGGMYCTGPTVPLVTGCEFNENTSRDKGGAVGLSTDSGAIFAECQFRANEASHGGALFAQSCMPTLKACTFVENTARSAGGAVGCGGGASVVVERCAFVRNAVEPFYGRGGGALDCAAASLALESCTLAANTAPHGSGIAASDDAEVTMLRCIVAFGGSGEAVRCGDDTGSTVISSCSAIYGNEGGDWIGCLTGQLGVRGNFAADPLFCDAAIGDFTLDRYSPCMPGQNPYGEECGLVGAFGLGCGNPTATMPTTWGGLKARFE